MNTYYVYMLMNFNNSVIYTGVTNDIVRREFEHKNKVADGFTRKYNVEKLVWFDVSSSIENAILCEKKLKGWSRLKKLKLISDKNPDFKDLYPAIV